MSTIRVDTRVESQELERITLTPLQPAQWCKIFWHKNEAGQEYYFSNFTTGETTYEEPTEDYWLWDYATGTYHVSGLQKPTPKEQRKLFPTRGP